MSCGTAFPNPVKAIRGLLRISHPGGLEKTTAIGYNRKVWTDLPVKACWKKDK